MPASASKYTMTSIMGYGKDKGSMDRLHCRFLEISGKHLSTAKISLRRTRT